MIEDIGIKIKKLRTDKKLTLKTLGEKTGLSSGFLSQLERGLTTIAVDSLQDIAKELGVDSSYFFSVPTTNKEDIICSYQQTVSRIESDIFIHFHLSNDLQTKHMLPEIITLLPSCNKEAIKEFRHAGEELVYVLEGILTLFINHEKHQLYPGDSIHFNSNLVHNWCNCTNKITKILVVRTPNPYRLSENNSSL